MLILANRLSSLRSTKPLLKPISYNYNLAITTSPPSPPQDATIVNLVLKTDSQALTRTLEKYPVEWTPDLVDRVLKLLWNHGPKALQFFKSLDYHPTYAHVSSSFDHAIDIAGRLRDYKTLWTLVDRMRTRRLGPNPKTFAIITESFLSLYNRDGVEPIGLDDAASRLGVERRRIYDIVNVLESVGVLARKAKNQYSWKGFGAIPKALEELREEGLRENFHSFDSNNSAKISDDEDERFSNPNTGSQQDKSNPNNRREKSLGLLTQNFVKLFLCSNVDLISLEEAARILLGDGQNSSIMRTKVRRLYDIANVLSSMNLIEKTNQTENRKPAFRWLGMRGKSENGSFSVLNLNESKKRTFGTEITNISLKRNKMASSVEGNSNQNTKMQWQMQVKHESLENGIERSDVEKGPKQSSKSYQFGPFAPVSVQDTVRQVRDWESLASTYRPQYHSQALRDLFAHYMEAWKTWYSEVAGKEPIQIS